MVRQTTGRMLRGSLKAIRTERGQSSEATDGRRFSFDAK